MGALEDLREVNRLRVVDALRLRGAASRADLARATGLSRTTITTLVAELTARGLVREEQAGSADRAQAGRGRPPVRLRLQPSAGTALGIDFGHRHVRVVLADLSSAILAERTLPMDVDAAAAASLNAAAELVDAVLTDAGVDRARVVGAGAGLPGPIDRRTATVGSSVILRDWAGVDAREQLQRRLGLPVEVDNDANLGALAEAAFGAGRGLTDVVYVKVASGLGAGLMLGGRLHRGASGIAGELGHVRARADGPVCRCGRRGCLETVASAESVAAKLAARRGGAVTPREVVELVRAGDPDALGAVRAAGEAIGAALAALCNHVNPEAVIVGGELAGAGPPLIDAIRTSLRTDTLGEIAERVTVREATLGERAEALGAVAMVLGDTERLRSAGLVALRG